jgi:hypothetical protein
MLKIIDNAISERYQELIEAQLLGGGFPWLLQQDITYNIFDPAVKHMVQDKHPGFGRTFFNSSDGGIIEPSYFYLLLPLLYNSCHKGEVEVNNIINVRTFLQLPLHKEICKEHNNPHTDLKFPHMVCLYYANDSDGPTYIFDQTLDDISFEDHSSERKFTVKQKIEPKRGRAVLFDGRTYHASSSSSKDVRCIVNFNFK